jgi:hypothetical protein
MVLPFALAYASILALAVAWGFIELWAKSYDMPGAQQVAKAAEVAIFLVAAYAVADLALVTSAVRFPAQLLGWVACSPPVVALLWTVHELDWRHVYASAAVGTLLPLLARPDIARTQSLAPGGLALLVVVMAVRAEQVPVRLRRYTTMLRWSCSCCGYKQKAVRVLCSLGDAGERIVREYLHAHPESRVESELARCRPTHSGRSAAREPPATDGGSGNGRVGRKER